MILLNKILLAIDFRNSSENIVENAIGMAKVFSSEISVIHVLDDEIKDQKIKLLVQEAVTERLKAIKLQIKTEGVQTGDLIIEYGSFYDKISQTADTMNANLIVIGSAEKLKDDSFKLGVTAEKIIRKSDKPVWVIKEDVPLKINNILCPVDFSVHSARALNNAVTLARRFKAKLHVLNVYKEISTGPLNLTLNLEKENERKKRESEEMFDSFLKKFNLIDLDWKKEIRQGDPSKEILNAVSDFEIDLLMMGTTGKYGLGKMVLGSVTEKVIREVPCSFITLKSEDIIDLQLETEIRDLQSHFTVAEQLVKDGFFEDAINEYKICLNINQMHLPSLIGISRIHKMTGNAEKEKKYKKLAEDVRTFISNRKIEEEIRKFFE